MAEQIIVSPGVFTRQNDLSYLPAGIASIGAAIIGPTVKGPAFIPTKVTPSQRIKIFGDVNQKFYSTYAAKQYLRQADSVTIVRTLWQQYYSGSYIHITSGSGTSQRTLAVLGATVGNNITASSLTMSAEQQIHDIKFSVDGVSYTASLLQNSGSTYLPYLFSSDPMGSTKLYIHKFFPDYVSGNSGSLASVTGSIVPNYYGSYSNASTPWLISQYDNTQLFKVHTISDGTAANTQFKVAIVNVKQGRPLYGQPYASFDLILRKFDDEDVRPVIIQQFTGLNLDPTSIKYIGRQIGDKHLHFDSDRVKSQGDFQNKSKNIRIELSPAVKNKAIDPSSMVVGYEPPYTTVTGIDITGEDYQVNKKDPAVYNSKQYQG